MTGTPTPDDLLTEEAIRGFLLEKHLPFDQLDPWTDEIMAIVREHRDAARLEQCPHGFPEPGHDCCRAGGPMTDTPTPIRFDRYISRPQEIEAAQWDGTTPCYTSIALALPGKVRLDSDGLRLLAGKDGAQEWVPVPVDHWLVHMPGDLSDVWPVDPDYFAAKYVTSEDR